MLIGKVQGPKTKPYMDPRDALLPGDLLRIGYEDQSWHRTIRITKHVPKKGKYFLSLSENRRLLRYVQNLKSQLYDFPRRNYGKKWNLKNLQEHREFVKLVQSSRAIDAADYMRDIHWEFKPPDSFTVIPKEKTP
jgi:hypothetical protein